MLLSELVAVEVSGKTPPLLTVSTRVELVAGAESGRAVGTENEETEDVDAGEDVLGSPDPGTVTVIVVEDVRPPPAAGSSVRICLQPDRLNALHSVDPPLTAEELVGASPETRLDNTVEFAARASTVPLDPGANTAALEAGGSVLGVGRSVTKDVTAIIRNFTA